MAGRPRTRARREAEARAAARASIPDAEPLPVGPNAPTSARVHARARIPLPGFVGAQTKATADNLEAERLANVAAQIRPGVTVQIERTRPTWCAGYLEDYPIDEQGDSFAELRAYIRDTYGGARYRLAVLSSQGVELAIGSFPVAAPPKDRGKPIDRHAWEGEASAPTRAAAAVAAPTPAASADAGLAGVLLEILRDSNKNTVEAVREMTKQTREQTTELVKSVVATRSAERTDERRERSITSQLDELVGVTRAVDKVQRQLFSAARGGTDAPSTPEELDEKAEREASSMFRRAVMSKLFGMDQAAPSSGQQPPKRPRVTIPDAPPAAPNGKGN